jgi:hypothetical protein
MENKMTFEEFQATRRWSEDLATDASSDNWETGVTRKGNLYIDRLYVGHVEPDWPADARAEGEWYLLLNNSVGSAMTSPALSVGCTTGRFPRDIFRKGDMA